MYYFLSLGEFSERFRRNSLLHYLIVFMSLFMYSLNNIHRTTNIMFFLFLHWDRLEMERKNSRKSDPIRHGRKVWHWPPSMFQCFKSGDEWSSGADAVSSEHNRVMEVPGALKLRAEDEARGYLLEGQQHRDSGDTDDRIQYNDFLSLIPSEEDMKGIIRGYNPTKDNLYWLMDFEHPTICEYLVCLQCQHPPWCVPEPPLGCDQERVDWGQ